MKIGIDIDEIVVEFLRGYLDFYNEIHNTNFKFDDNYSYRFEEFLNTSKERAVKTTHDFFETESFENLDLVEGVRELILEISKNHQVIFITARHLMVKEKTRIFLEKHFPNLPLRIFHTGDYFEGNKTKAEICEQQGVDFLIEDNEDYARSCADKGVKVFLLEKPWNKNCEAHPNIIKINHLKEVLDKIK
ncbi:MAG: hypothetical protein IIA85_01690 [Nanoarchaeota archaeon]|nr:hypothetical protein [Nanoarchaeota archaeon]